MMDGDYYETRDLYSEEAYRFSDFESAKRMMLEMGDNAYIVMDDGYSRDVFYPEDFA